MSGENEYASVALLRKNLTSGINLSSDEFRIRLKIIRNSTEIVVFEVRIRGQHSYLTRFDGRL